MKKEIRKRLKGLRTGTFGSPLNKSKEQLIEASKAGTPTETSSQNPTSEKIETEEGDLTQVNLIPTRIEMLTTEIAPKNLVNGLINCGCFASVWRGFELPPYRYSLISQPPQGNILLGEVVNYVENKASTIEGMKTIATHAIRMMPRLRDLNVIRSWAGLLACPPDYLPILGKPYDLENFVMACGWVGSGIGFSAITGKLVSEIIIDGEPSTSIDSLGYPRP